MRWGFRAVVVLATVMVLGLLTCYIQWSTLPFRRILSGENSVANWACETCSANQQIVAQKTILHTADLLNQTPDGDDLDMQEVHRASLPPCRGTSHENPPSKADKDIWTSLHFIPESRNPCWWSGTNGSINAKLLCLPYFFLAGVSKCGSTDIFARLSGHPQVVPPAQKEACWFDRERFSKVRGHLFMRYVSNFMQASWQISRDIGTFGISGKVVGDGSPTYFWRNFHWEKYAGNEGCSEPRVVIPDIIQQILPRAKFIISFRDPVSSIYSKYLSMADSGAGPRSPEHFHSQVELQIRRYQDCFSHSSVRGCAYNVTLSMASEIRLEKGLYAVFLSDWLRVFSRKQIHIIRFEDYMSDIAGHLQKLFQFLQLDAMEDNALRQLSAHPASNKGRHYNVGDMLPATRFLLQQFYSSFNKQLADLLHDKRFMWLS